ncbi:MAG: Y-family DNA polymerase [Bacteroidales bacterium]|nr:Y-family DNA polymerase [Bacteroidales bacterium]
MQIFSMSCRQVFGFSKLLCHSKPIPPMYLHIDCNSYFASCEVATRPGLEGKPVVVANDNEAGGGIILALTAEAKALGLKRGMPLFKVRNLIRLNNVVVCPVDHKKYHRISRQIMEAVQRQEIVLDFVQYSVDEFFGTLPIEEPDEVRHYVRKVMDLITSTTGIPVSCGCSQSYTLAKVATHYAKKYKGYKGICVLTPESRKKALSMLDIADVWGIGRKNQKKLTERGIRTAQEFADCEEKLVGSLFSATGVRTWQELRGIPCIELDRPERQRSIMQSRTFARMTDKLEDLERSVRTYATACAVKLRGQQSVCRTVTVFLATNRHREDLEQYRNSAAVRLPSPVSDTPTLLKAASAALKEVFREGFMYKQAGVVLTDITDEEGMQLDLFSEPDDARHRKLMQVADGLNKKFGNDTVSFGTRTAHDDPPEEE